MMQQPRSKDPDRPFKDMMQDFTKSFAGKAASTEDFKAVVERHMTDAMVVDSSRNMDWFFNEYVYGTGIAQYHLDYAIEAQPNNQWLLKGTITQTGVPDGWEDSVPVYLRVQGQTGRLGWVKARGKTTPFQIMLGFQPSKVSLNDNSEILAEIK
jgi:hypothetical protein